MRELGSLQPLHSWELFHDILCKWKKGDKHEVGKKGNLGVGLKIWFHLEPIAILTCNECLHVHS